VIAKEAFVVRPMVAADEVPRVERMWQALYELQREQGMSMSATSGAFAEWASSMTPILGRFAELFVAERTGGVVGFLAVRLRRAPQWFGGATVGFISEVWVEPEVRGRRLGEQLVRAAQDWLQSQGIERAELQVMQANHAARALYRRLGWHDELVLMTRQSMGPAS
jgi:ribosomal protein S18 acetylase RimI-like enzyme